MRFPSLSSVLIIPCSGLQYLCTLNLKPQQQSDSLREILKWLVVDELCRGT